MWTKPKFNLAFGKAVEYMGKKTWCQISYVERWSHYCNLWHELHALKCTEEYYVRPLTGRIYHAG